MKIFWLEHSYSLCSEFITKPTTRRDEDEMLKRNARTRGRGEKKNPFRRFCLLVHSGTNVSVSSWGRSAPLGHCFFFFFSFKGGQDINEVQQPLCRSHSLQDIDDMMMCACARVLVRLCLQWLMTPSVYYTGRASLSLQYICVLLIGNLLTSP